MSKLQRIPRRILKDSVEYSQKSNTARGTAFGLAQTVSKVHVQIADVVKRTQIGEETIGRGIMYVDPSYSSKSDFVKGSKIVYKGIEYIIKEIDTLEVFGEVHHLEVLLK